MLWMFIFRLNGSVMAGRVGVTISNSSRFQTREASGYDLAWKSFLDIPIFKDIAPGPNLTCWWWLQADGLVLSLNMRMLRVGAVPCSLPWRIWNWSTFGSYTLESKSTLWMKKSRSVRFAKSPAYRLSFQERNQTRPETPPWQYFSEGNRITSDLN